MGWSLAQTHDREMFGAGLVGRSDGRSFDAPGVSIERSFERGGWGKNRARSFSNHPTTKSAIILQPPHFFDESVA